MRGLGTRRPGFTLLRIQESQILSFIQYKARSPVQAPLTHGLVVGLEALVEYVGAVLLIGEVCVEGQQYLVSLGYEFHPSRGVAQGRAQLPTEHP